MEGFEVLRNSSSPEEASIKGIVTLGALIMSLASAEDANVSLIYGGFLAAFLHNIVLRGSQAFVPNSLISFYLIY